MDMSANKLLFLLTLLCFQTSLTFAQEQIEIGDSQWRLWPDKTAAWENDDLFLPNTFNIDELPVNAPTCGWAALNQQKEAVEVSLPTTVEQHFWGTNGLKAYEDAYGFETEDKQVKDGRYLGVSWWSKSVFIPKSAKGKKLILNIRGARLRAEVYLNHQLVGYNIISETSFQCDLSKAFIAGQNNELDIRITNPGGQMDWIDPIFLQWGKYSFHRSHGFGGIDRGMSIEVQDKNIQMQDLYVLNTSDLDQVDVYAVLHNDTDKAIKGAIEYTVFDQDGKAVKAFKSDKITIDPQQTTTIKEACQLEGAKMWTLEDPNLYQVKAQFKAKKSKLAYRTQTFGFRWFNAEGIGKDAYLSLNHQRIRLLSAISWGYWGLNGLFPSHELAKKEVMAAKNLGMNCLHFHRNIGRKEVFDLQDSLGLLRMMEPGGGRTALQNDYKLDWEGVIPASHAIDVWGKDGEAETFAQKYMEAKIIQMIRDARSHPSLVAYNLQNEVTFDLANPRIWHVLRRMQQEDPSRVITLKSGVNPEGQVTFLPYTEAPIYDKGDGFGGWIDEHTVGGPGVWKDELYKSDKEFTHRTEIKDQIVVWGEMLGAATPDNAKMMIEYINAHGGKSYDLIDQQEMNKAYGDFIKKWGFEGAYADAGELFKAIGRKSYEFWGKVIETAKLSDENDGFIMNGWESTAIENHSGLVDNQRRHKSDPALVANRVQALRSTIRLNHQAVQAGEQFLADLYLVNESHQAHAKQAKLVLRKSNKVVWSKDFSVPTFKKNKFVYPIAKQVALPATLAEGKYELSLEISGLPTTAVANEKLTVLDSKINFNPEHYRVGIVGNNPSLKAYIHDQFGMDAEYYQPKNQYDLLILSDEILIGGEARGVKVPTPIEGTGDDYLYQTEVYGDTLDMTFTVEGLANGQAEVTLKYAEVYCNAPKTRMFDVALNGKVVEHDFDLFTEGGFAQAIDREYKANIVDGKLVINIPRISCNMAKMCAFKVVDANGKTQAFNLGGEAYTDVKGLKWQQYVEQTAFVPSLDFSVEGVEHSIDIPSLFAKIKAGTQMLMMPLNAGAVVTYGQILEDEQALTFDGQVGNALQAWMGSWIFTKSSDLFKDLPQNTAFAGDYQIGAVDANGMIISGKNIAVDAGYARDHNRNIGAASFSVKVGDGTIVVHNFYGLGNIAKPEDERISKAFAKQILVNALNLLYKNYPKTISEISQD
ncbi:hypothetical protein PEPS_42070 (plasmid) [Persicobacter psychrovividus]|uniref:Beta-galactosidase n=2 Tax=Persicobacter psychrovividus TaxID=387638 RepID=A0ABM7VLP3_9BACT|nr:hypothetical protein PEPS_42070 [Persicobacter psychrovividus]